MPYVRTGPELQPLEHTQNAELPSDVSVPLAAKSGGELRECCKSPGETTKLLALKIIRYIS